jgi:serine/threonine protein phosphatase PrpC
LHEINFDSKDGHLFGVFDGHGGCEVAIYSSRVLAEVLLQQPEYAKRQYSEAFQKCFMRVDELML